MTKKIKKADTPTRTAGFIPTMGW